jgi:hypothetical protein
MTYPFKVFLAHISNNTITQTAFVEAETDVEAMQIAETTHSCFVAQYAFKQKTADHATDVAALNYTRVPKMPVCAKAGILPYQCNSLPVLRVKGKAKGSWMCEEHNFQVNLPPVVKADSVESMTNEELDAELRQFGVDPDELEAYAFNKLCVLFRKVSDENARLKAEYPLEDGYVAWLRFDNGAIKVCDSDVEGAFRVYRRKIPMGTLYWSKGADLEKLPEMNPATKEQLKSMDIQRDAKGRITGIKRKTE